MGSLRPGPQKQTREEESPEEGPSRQTQVRRLRDIGSEGRRGGDNGVGKSVVKECKKRDFIKNVKNY